MRANASCARIRSRGNELFFKQNLRHRRVTVAKCAAIRYCANNDAKLFNNRLVSQRFILLARSPSLEATNSTSSGVEERE